LKINQRGEVASMSALGCSRQQTMMREHIGEP
jgi:hypothetical protein